MGDDFKSNRHPSAAPILILGAEGPLRALPEDTKSNLIFREYSDICFSFRGGQVTVTDEPVDGLDLREFSLAVFASPRGGASFVGALVDYFKHEGVTIEDHWPTGLWIPNKLTQYVRLSQSGLPVPDSFFAPLACYREFSEIVKLVGSPFIMKSINGSGGRNNYLIRDPDDNKTVLESVPNSGGLRMIAQRWIPNNGDLRVLIMGEKISAVIHRTPVAGSHLANTSQGGHADWIPPADLPETVASLALRAAEVMNAPVAGVDLIQDCVSNDWYILEVNSSPSITSGAFPDRKTAAYIEHVNIRMAAQMRPAGHASS